MLLQCGVNERTKHAVSLGAVGGMGGSSFYITSAGLSTVQNTVNTKCCVSIRTSLSCICIKLAFCRRLKERISMSYGGFDCSMFIQLSESARRDGLFTMSRLWGDIAFHYPVFQDGEWHDGLK